jgi:S1-C subfamily serine protease
VLKEKMFRTSRPTTGLLLGTVPDDGQGVRVSSVIPGSLAEQAGLRAEDVVLAVDGMRFDDLSGARAVQIMKRAISRAEAGTSLRIEYLRGSEINITDTRTQTPAEIAQLRDSLPKDQNNPTNQPETVPEPSRQRSTALDGGAVIHWSGLTFVNMTRGLGPYFGTETGVLLVHSDERLPLMEGDVILKIGKQALVNASQALSLLQGYDPDETVTVEIWRHGQSILLEFTFDTPAPPDEQVARNLR